jgi:hypothetical protein
VNACASRHHKSRNPDRRIDHGHGQWSYGGSLAGGASAQRAHWEIRTQNPDGKLTTFIQRLVVW